MVEARRMNLTCFPPGLEKNVEMPDLSTTSIPSVMTSDEALYPGRLTIAFLFSSLSSGIRTMPFSQQAFRHALISWNCLVVFNLTSLYCSRRQEKREVFQCLNVHVIGTNTSCPRCCWVPSWSMSNHTGTETFNWRAISFQLNVKPETIWTFCKPNFGTIFGKVLVRFRPVRCLRYLFAF